MPPSTLSLLGLVWHMAEVERAWFRRVFEDHDAPMVWSEEIDLKTEAFPAWEAEVENSRRIEREAESLDLPGHQPRWGEDVSLRMVMVHVLLEYGRQTGARSSCVRVSTGPKAVVPPGWSAPIRRCRYASVRLRCVAWLKLRARLIGGHRTSGRGAGNG